MAKSTAERQQDRKQRHVDAGFAETRVYIARGTTAEVQKYAYKVAKKAGLVKP